MLWILTMMSKHSQIQMYGQGLDTLYSCLRLYHAWPGKAYMYLYMYNVLDLIRYSKLVDLHVRTLTGYSVHVCTCICMYTHWRSLHGADVLCTLCSDQHGTLATTILEDEIGGILSCLHCLREREREREGERERERERANVMICMITIINIQYSSWTTKVSTEMYTV